MNLETGFLLSNWRVSPSAGQLSTGWLKKTVRRVEPRAMQVLLALAERPGQFQSKDDLIAKVWDGRSVGDDSLTGAIHALRHALGDNPRKPRFIETRNNVGYRLIADVRPDAALKAPLTMAASIVVAAAAVFFLLSLNNSESTEPDPLTIAVLPFVNQSGSAGDDFFASAMTDSLISDLARGRRVRVISRTSVNGLDDKAGSAQDIAQVLGADMLVEGAVQTSGDQVRVSAQLIDPFATEHLWSEQFHRTRGNALELQRDVSREIAARIGVVVGYPQAPALDLPADELRRFLESRYLLAKEAPPAAEIALRGFVELAQSHPRFAPAWLGQAESLLFLFKSGERGQQGLREALVAAEQFETLYGSTPASHRCIGQVYLFLDWDFATAEQRYRQAILQNSSDTIARHRYAWLLVAQQRYAEAKAQIQYIRIVDPLSYARPELATLMLYSNEIEAAIAEFERLDASLALGKGTLRVMASAYLAAGREDDARRTLIRMLEVSSAADAADSETLQAFDNAELYRHILAVKLFRSKVASAGFHALLGNTDAALGDLEQALQRHDPFLFYVAALPELSALHTQPRFRAILRDIGVRVSTQHQSDSRELPSQSSDSLSRTTKKYEPAKAQIG